MHELDRDDPKWQTRLRVTQIIAAALLIGLLSFTGVVVYLVQSGAQPLPQNQLFIMTYLTLGLFLLQALLALVMPRKIANYNVQQVAAGTWQMQEQPVAADHFATDTDKLLAIYQTALIIQLALLEGVGFFACIAYLLEQQVIILVVLGLIVLFLLISFPGQERMRRWIEHQSRRIEEIRQTSELR